MFLFFLKVNGINILKLHAGTAEAYGRMLLDMLFTRNELKESLLFASARSEKKGLEQRKVELLLSKLTTILYCDDDH